MNAIAISEGSDALKNRFPCFSKGRAIELIELLGSEADYYPWRNIR